jgi:hypothetical protein
MSSKTQARLAKARSPLPPKAGPSGAGRLRPWVGVTTPEAVVEALCTERSHRDEGMRGEDGELWRYIPATRTLFFWCRPEAAVLEWTKDWLKSEHGFEVDRISSITTQTLRHAHGHVSKARGPCSGFR